MRIMGRELHWTSDGEDLVHAMCDECVGGLACRNARRQRIDERLSAVGFGQALQRVERGREIAAPQGRLGPRGDGRSIFALRVPNGTDLHHA